MQDLDDIARRWSAWDGFNGRVIAHCYERLVQHFRGRTCLEFGCADGNGLRTLLDRFDRITAVDGSAVALLDAREWFESTRLTLVCSRFESLALTERFDTVHMGHVLEHVDDPQAVLAVAVRHMAPGGVLVASVPSADSLHRAVGVRMGLLQRATDLNDEDRRIGHQRVYTREAFRTEIERAGLRVVLHGGLLLKPLSAAQMEALPEATVSALFALGEQYPEIAAEQYVVAEVPA